MYNSGVGIVTKNCERYIQEVCCYNHLIGFNKIYICLNDCEDSTYQRIYKLPDVVLNKVEVCNTKDLSGGGGGVAGGFQREGYEVIINRCRGRVRWLAFFDDDEYLYLKHYNSVNELLDSAHDDTGQIIIPWLNYGPNKQVLSPSHRDTRLSWFNTREHNVKNSNGLITSLFKVIVKLDDIIGVIDNARYYNDWYYCHSLKHIKGSWRDTDGNMPNLVQPGLYNGCVISPSQVLLTEEPDNVCLVHYQIGSMEDHIRRHQIWEKTFSTNSERKLTCSFDQFIYSASNFTIEDNRMLKYKIELKNLLQQCQAT